MQRERERGIKSRENERERLRDIKREIKRDRKRRERRTCILNQVFLHECMIYGCLASTCM